MIQFWLFSLLHFARSVSVDWECLSAISLNPWAVAFTLERALQLQIFIRGLTPSESGAGALRMKTLRVVSTGIGLREQLRCFGAHRFTVEVFRVDKVDIRGGDSR